jgi:hypothetical protein
MAKSGQTNGQSIYSRLPLTYYDSVYRLEELKNSIAMLKPKEAEESISQFCDWILELQEAHQKLAKTFSKTESMKPNSEQEAKTAKKFAELRHQAFLVKAEFLINQKRYPEALGPLTDVVNAEPGTELGQTAYKYLQKIGFSEPVEVYVGAAQAPSKTIANGSKLSDK